MTTTTPPTGFLHLVVGYDGSPPATRALDAAVRLLQGRDGSVEVLYVSHISSLAMLSPGAIAEVETGFDEFEQELRTSAAEQLRDRGIAWEFGRREGLIEDELIAAAKAIRDADATKTVAIVVGSHPTPPTVSSVRSPSAWPVTRRCPW
jgi:nucleotide-binding universal stress UspA family protein